MNTLCCHRNSVFIMSQVSSLHHPLLKMLGSEWKSSFVCLFSTYIYNVLGEMLEKNQMIHSGCCLVEMVGGLQYCAAADWSGVCCMWSYRWRASAALTQRSRGGESWKVGHCLLGGKCRNEERPRDCQSLGWMDSERKTLFAVFFYPFCLCETEGSWDMWGAEQGNEACGE